MANTAVLHSKKHFFFFHPPADGEAHHTSTYFHTLRVSTTLLVQSSVYFCYTPITVLRKISIYSTSVHHHSEASLPQQNGKDKEH